MTTLQQNKRVFAAVTIAVSFSAIASFKVDAAIITVNDSGSWINGTNTIANQGFNLIPVPNGSEALGSDLSTLSSPTGNIDFTNSVNKRQVGILDKKTGWESWSNGYQGEVYYSGKDVLTLDIKLPNLNAFDFYIQPDFQEISTISVIAQSGTLSEVLSQDVVNGLGGAKYFGFYSDDPLDSIQSIRIEGPKSGGFAIGQLRGANTKTASVPTPVLLPGLIGLGLGLWRKARNRQSEN
ncbi:PTPA-CTERM sorting domain-containing protein [Leptolyngbya sp. NIES-2104]|uniref:PTPA-CTERM sorting domain-containing protein n=1 Tax=Leptolyngbya sp. NIES-2104 TaxID=1552121 RepID=UPI0006ECC57E|nr:PTPA-CTERM sorting domain-containing protein [Leptolyngbya sp. NIES-2104]GAP95173.1 hypothetical protein NIES2104_16930 [Leptolyngbya sp. NIES-2104]